MRYRLVVAVLVTTFVASGVSFVSADSHPTEDDVNRNLEIHPDIESAADTKDEERAFFGVNWFGSAKSHIPGLKGIGNKDDAVLTTVKSSLGRTDDTLEQVGTRSDEIVEDAVKVMSPTLQKAEQKVAEAGVVTNKLKEMTKEAAKALQAKQTKLEGLEKSLIAAKLATRDAKAAEKAATALEKKAAHSKRIMAEADEKGAAALVKGALAETKEAGKTLTKVGKFWDVAKTKQVKLRGQARRIEAGGAVRPTKKMVAGALATVAMIFAALAGMSAMKSAANDKLVPLESMSGSGMLDSSMSDSIMPDTTMSGSDMSDLLGL
uniref:Uncharacterized protein n=1 Tax=Peronospora matthiolae TaxID=2874970 RepID=A0AAV1UXW3_9STRA